MYSFIAYDIKAPLPSQGNCPYGSLCILYYFKKNKTNACFDTLASKPRSARSLLAVKEMKTERKNTKVVPLTIGRRDVSTLMDSALVGR